MMMMTNHIHPVADNSQQSPQSIADYLAQLLKDRKQLAALPNVFTHLERLLDEGEFKFLILTRQLVLYYYYHYSVSVDSNKNFIEHLCLVYPNDVSHKINITRK